jgi:DNA-binding FadR family transcriptional regulator
LDSELETLPARDRRIYRAVGENLTRRIMAGEFSSLGRLPSERELAEAYGVGRAVIRDALVMLEVKGLVEVRQGSGIYVSRRAYEAHALEFSDLPSTPLSEALPTAGPFELLQARQWIESHVARLAATYATPTDLSAIETACNDHRLASFGEAKEGMDIRFHLAIAQATQNMELVAVVSHLWHRRDNNPLWRQLNTKIRDPYYRDRWVSDHLAVCEAIKARDPEAAYVAMWSHIDNVKIYLMAQVKSGHAPDE